MRQEFRLHDAVKTRLVLTEKAHDKQTHSWGS